MSELSEMSPEEFDSLLNQIRADFTESDCQQEILDASRYNEIDVVRALLQVHPNLVSSSRDSRGNTPLHMAAANGHAELTQLLLQAGADVSATNSAGNTPLHWASTNGRDETVRILLQSGRRRSDDDNSDVSSSSSFVVDVLRQNKFGRSALTEGFSSENTSVVQALLEHDSAAEERLLQQATNQSTVINKIEPGEMGTTSTSQTCNAQNNTGNSSSTSITHDFIFHGEVRVRARELAMAESEHDAILGPAFVDTTGLGIWASSIVLAQWLVAAQVVDVQQPAAWRNAAKMTSTTTMRILELGAGCGLPSLALACALASSSRKNPCGVGPYTIYATDCNSRTVENIGHNIGLNNWNISGAAKSESPDVSGPVSVEALDINWNDPHTWPRKPVDCVIGSDLIYQSDMVPGLVQTIVGLLNHNDNNNHARFLYVARADGERQGHNEFLELMANAKFDRWEMIAPPEFNRNPLLSQDDDLCFLHFHELQSSQYKLYEFFPANRKT